MASLPTQGSAIAAFPTLPPMPAVARILARFERDQLAGFIAVAIDLLDTFDGDPDAEEIPVEDAQITYDLPPEEDPTDADLEDATDLEDDHSLSPLAIGYWRGRPGCPASDTDEDDDPETGIEDDPRGCDPESDFGADEAGAVFWNSGPPMAS